MEYPKTNGAKGAINLYDVSRGIVDGMQIVDVLGRNFDVDTGTVPEDMWGGGGLYTGFPTGAAEEFQVLSDNVADTGVLTFFYLPSFTSTKYLTATVTLNGTTPVNTGVSGVRLTIATYNNANPTTFNVGTITVRHSVTTTNVFCVVPAGRSQTNVGGYTVPFGSVGILLKYFCFVRNTTSGSVDGAIWYREFGQSPRLRRPFTATSTFIYAELPTGGIILPALTDIIMRVSSASVNNLDVIGGFDLLVLKV